MDAARHETSCPDCGRRFNDELVIRHDLTCPIALELEKAMEADRQYFANNPNLESYTRRLLLGEIMDFGWQTGCITFTHCRVTQLEPGVRLRQPFTCLGGRK